MSTGIQWKRLATAAPTAKPATSVSCTGYPTGVDVSGASGRSDQVLDCL